MTWNILMVVLVLALLATLIAVVVQTNLEKPTAEAQESVHTEVTETGIVPDRAVFEPVEQAYADESTQAAAEAATVFVAATAIDEGVGPGNETTEPPSVESFAADETSDQQFPGSIEVSESTQPGIDEVSQSAIGWSTPAEALIGDQSGAAGTWDVPDSDEEAGVDDDSAPDPVTEVAVPDLSHLPDTAELFSPDFTPPAEIPTDEWAGSNVPTEPKSGATERLPDTAELFSPTNDPTVSFAERSEETPNSEQPESEVSEATD
jgi:hypothetical protein